MNNKQFNKLNIVSYDTSRAWAMCPFHDDKVRPNLSISLDDKYFGKYKCWACNATGRLSKNQINKLQLDKYLVEIKKPVNIISDIVKYYNNQLREHPLFITGLANILNVSESLIVNDWDIGFDGQNYTIPMYGVCDEICGIQKRTFDGKKFCEPGSKLGIFRNINVFHYNYRVLFICEGFSDTICVDDLGYYTIGRANCWDVNNILNFLYRDDKVGSVVIIPDMDEVGLAGAELLKSKIISHGLCFSVKLFKFEGAKDIRELIQKKGKGYVDKLLGTEYE